jgi:hypothetical protein
MAGGFEVSAADSGAPCRFTVPQGLIDREARGLDLIMHARSLWGVPADWPVMMAPYMLAEWIMTDPPALVPAIERGGLNVGGVLAGVDQPSPTAAHFLHNLTGGAIRLADWTRPYSGAGEPAAATSPGHFVLVGENEYCRTFTISPIVHGKLGEREPGSTLFRCIRGEGQNRFVLTGLCVAWALDRGAATSAAQALAGALGLQLVEPEQA